MLAGLTRVMEGHDLATFRWIVGGLLGVIMSVGSYWLKRLTDQLESLKSEFHHRGQRISSLEAHVEGVKTRLDRIEQKLDFLIHETRVSK